MAGYGDDDGFSDWLADNGYVLPDDAPTPAVLRQRGSAYVDATYSERVYGDGFYAPHFSGAPTAGLAQERAWPRTGATAYGSPIPDDVIPVAIVQASYYAALEEANSPGSLSVAVTGSAQIKREKTDVLETEYFPGSGGTLANSTPMLSAVDGLLAPFLIGMMDMVTPMIRAIG